MLRILKYLSKAEIGQMLIALVTIVGQVFFDLKLPDYMSDITTLVETPGSAMSDIWIAGGKMLLISLGSVACAIVTGYISARVGSSFTQRLRSLEFRKVESGNLKIRVSQGDVAAFVRKCVEAFAPLVSKKRLRVYFQSSADRIEGWFDSDKLDKIVYNLLSNAAKYTPDKGEIIIRIETGDDCSVCISVANSGELMTQQTIDGLFRRF